MASIRAILSERRYPFLLTLVLLLLIFLSLLLLSTGDGNSFLSFYLLPPKLLQPHSSTSSRPGIPLAPSPPPTQSMDLEEQVRVQGGREEEGDEGGGLEYRWEICGRGKGFEAVDYIPCLDNWKAIKELKSRRHMEHRERHCPHPAPQCLVPLPKGYRVPVPWPRSRDMVRLLLW